ncbi:MAG: ABC transporter ATP-binding protein [Flavobacteriales bacterium]
MIEVKQVTKKYRNAVVLDMLELLIPDGQCFGLVGNNGAGKTTFFNLLLDLVPATTGSIRNNGTEVDKDGSWKKHTAAYLDESFLIGYLTPEEYFHFIGELRQCDKATVDVFLEAFAPFFNGEVLGQRKYLRDLSKGNQKKAGIVSALIGSPTVVVLDEPFANLDPSSQFRLKSIIKELTAQKDVTMLISSHDLAHVAEVCERIVVLEKGRMAKDIRTTPETLKELESMFATS